MCHQTNGLCNGSAGPCPITILKNSFHMGIPRRCTFLGLVAFLACPLRWDFCSGNCSLTSDNVASRLLFPADSVPSPTDSCRKSTCSFGVLYPVADRLKVSAIKAISLKLSLSLNREMSSIYSPKSKTSTVFDPDSGSVANPPELRSLPWRGLGSCPGSELFSP